MVLIIIVLYLPIWPPPPVASGNMIPEWVVSWGGIDMDSCRGIAVDSKGYVYVSGTFTGKADFDPDPVDEMSVSTDGTSYCAFLSKFDTTGEFIWVRTWEGLGFSHAVDSEGNIYLAGGYIDSADFDPGPGIEKRSALGNDAFLARLNPEGELEWVRTWGSDDEIWEWDEGATGVAIDGDGNVYVCGEFLRSVDFDPGKGVQIEESDGRDGFLVKYNSFGDFQWVRTIGSSWGRAEDVAVDSSGNAYVTGYVGYDPPFSTSSGKEAFLAKVDSDGTETWFHVWGGYGGVSGYQVAVDGNDDIYSYGSFNGTPDFDPGEEIVECTSHYGEDYYLSRFDVDGNFKWVRTWGANNGIIIETSGLCIDSIGNIHVAGKTSGNVDFDPDPIHTELRRFNTYFASVFSSDGDFLGVRTWEDLLVNAMASDCSGGVYITGHFWAAIDFDPGPELDLRTPVGWTPKDGYKDAILMKFPPFEEVERER